PPKDDKSALATQWTLHQFVSNSLNPTVIESEADEYLRYINHPSNLPLVVSTADHDASAPHGLHEEFAEYVRRGTDLEAAGTGEREEDDFEDFLRVAEDPLTVREGDGGKKRYKAYRQWLRGRSLFKQQRGDA
ncbi:MAG: hypothetical protein Q9200_006292, partial [Gallowayella weberi]